MTQGGRAQGARRRGPAPLSRDQSDLQLLGEAGGAARRRAAWRPDAARSPAPDRRHRRRCHAARRRTRRADDGRRLRRRAAGACAASAAASASSAPSPRAASARSSTTSTSDRARVAQGTTLRALITAPLQGRGAGHRRAGARQHGADGLHRRRAEAAEHAGLQAATAIENARLFERTVAGRARARAADGLQQETEVARAKLRERADAGGADPGATCFRPSCRACPATNWRRATVRRAGAAATTTTRSLDPGRRRSRAVAASPTSRARDCRRRS